MDMSLTYVSIFLRACVSTFSTDMWVDIFYRHVCRHFLQRMSLGMCIDIGKDTWHGQACRHVHRHVSKNVHGNVHRHGYGHVYRRVYTHVHIHMRMDIFTDMCIDVCIDMRANMCTDMCMVVFGGTSVDVRGHIPELASTCSQTYEHVHSCV